VITRTITFYLSDLIGVEFYIFVLATQFLCHATVHQEVSKNDTYY